MIITLFQTLMTTCKNLLYHDLYIHLRSLTGAANRGFVPRGDHCNLCNADFTNPSNPADADGVIVFRYYFSLLLCFTALSLCVRPSVCLSFWLSACLSVHLSLSFCVCVSLSSSSQHPEETRCSLLRHTLVNHFTANLFVYDFYKSHPKSVLEREMVSGKG